MKRVLLSADGEVSAYKVPDIVANNLRECYIEEFYKWMEKSQEAEKYRMDGGKINMDRNAWLD